MFKRIHSEKARPAIVPELKKEFGKYFSGINNRVERLFAKHPRQVFGLMITCILISAVLAFTVMRKKPERFAALKFPAGSSSPSILQTGNMLRDVLALQNQINTILHKDSLNAADSLSLRQAFRQLEIIQSQINPKQKLK